MRKSVLIDAKGPFGAMRKSVSIFARRILKQTRPQKARLLNDLLVGAMLKFEDSVLAAVQSSKDRLSESEALHLLACQWISKQSRTPQKDARLLILTEFNFHLYESKSFPKSVKLLHSHSWDQLKYLCCDSDLMTAHFHFSSEKVTSACSNGMDVVATVAQHLRTIFTPSEFSRDAIGVTDQFLVGYEPKKDAVVRRLRFKAFIAKRPVPPSLEQEILERINSYRAAERDNIAESFDLTPFLPYYDQMDLILDAIMVMPEVRRLIVPASTPGSPLWPKLSKFFAANETVSLVETKEPPDHTFRNFVRELSGKRSSGIHELKFSDAEYDAEFMVQLAILFESREITVLSVTNRATASGVLTLAAMLPSCVGFQNLRELTLAGCPMVPAKALLGPLPKLRTFTADDKSLDIGEFLAQFCECADSELEELTLLGGRVASLLPQSGVFPSHLARLTIPEAVWEGDNFSRLFAIIGRASLSLNVSRANLTESQWETFDEFLLGSSAMGLTGLIFDGNRVGLGLAALLAQCEDLQALSLNACAVDVKANTGIAAAIAASTTLHHLSIQGTRRDSYRNVMHVYAAAFLENKSLRALDVCGNGMGNAVLEMLVALYQKHPKIGELIFDHNGITDLDALRKLYEGAGQVERRIIVRFPSEDIERLRARGQIADMDIHRLRMQCADALRRKARKPRDQSSVDEDRGRRAPAMRPGEFLEMLVRGKGILAADVKDIVEHQIEEWIGDQAWAMATAIEIEDEKGEAVELVDAVQIEALFDAIS
jgi:hypothetical protein